MEKPEPPSKAKSMPKALTRDLVARGDRQVIAARVEHAHESGRLAVLLTEGNDVLDLHLAIVADPWSLH